MYWYKWSNLGFSFAFFVTMRGTACPPEAAALKVINLPASSA
jgi:hypothetical protein